MGKFIIFLDSTDPSTVKLPTDVIGPIQAGHIIHWDVVVSPEYTERLPPYIQVAFSGALRGRCGSSGKGARADMIPIPIGNRPYMCIPLDVVTWFKHVSAEFHRDGPYASHLPPGIRVLMWIEVAF